MTIKNEDLKKGDYVTIRDADPVMGGSRVQIIKLHPPHVIEVEFDNGRSEYRKSNEVIEKYTYRPPDVIVTPLADR